MKSFVLGESDINAMTLMDSTTQKLRSEGRQVMMIADNFATPAGFSGNLLSAEVNKSEKGVMAMLVDLINGIYSSRGISFKTAYKNLGKAAKERGLM